MKKLILVTMLAIICWSVNAQTITFNLVTAPCNFNGVLVIQTTGLTPPITYNYWNGSSSIIITTNYVNDTIFNYAGNSISVYATDGFAAWASNTFAGAPPFTIFVNSTPAICPNPGTGTAMISGGVAPYTVLWNDASGTVATGNPANLPPGSFYVYVTDAAGCAYSSIYDSLASANISNISPITATVNSTTASCTNGTATVSGAAGGIAPYTYLWSNGAVTSTVTGLMMGSYTVRVTDAQGCFNDFYTYVSQVPVISVNTVPTATTCLMNNGSAMVFGSGSVSPYSYLWSNGQTTQNAINLIGGWYPVTATDANGCIGTGGAYINTSTPITVTYSATSSLCTSPTGTATVTPVGGTLPYTIVWNTSPVQTGTTATALMPGNYYFTVTDAVGCLRTGTVIVPPVSVVTANILETDATCLLANGSAFVTPTAGVSPYSYLWSNGATTAMNNAIAQGYYLCVITDNLGCSITKCAWVNATSPITLNISTVPASCIYANDGSATVTPIGGTPPYIYSWTGGATTATATNLYTGNYWVTVHDATGCVQSIWMHVPYNPLGTSCYCTISGTVYHDINNNCIMDTGEPGIQNIQLHISGGIIMPSLYTYTYTDALGNYSFKVPSGNYTLSEYIGAFYPLSTCQINNIPITAVASAGCTITQDFANGINPIHELSLLEVNYAPPIPGNMYYQCHIVHNGGTLVESTIEEGYAHDGQLLFGTTTAPFTQLNSSMAPNWYSVVSGGYAPLNLANSFANYISYSVPTNVPLGTAVNFKDTIVSAAPMSTWVTDYTPWDNVLQETKIVVSSYDPNYKEVSPKGYDTPGYITTNDSVLTYTIHFQNTGTSPAQNIYLIDSLDNDLNIASVEPVYSNHSFTTYINESGVIKFSFDNIYLPDSTSQPLASIGFLVFRVHLKPGLVDYTQIKNNADIYFDYNAPITTNTTLNTLHHAAGINQLTMDNSQLTIYPNPTTGTLRISDFEFRIKEIKITNLLGELVPQSEITSPQFEISVDISGVANGIYFIQIKDEKNNVVNRKVVKQ